MPEGFDSQNLNTREPLRKGHGCHSSHVVIEVVVVAVVLVLLQDSGAWDRVACSPGDAYMAAPVGEELRSIAKLSAGGLVDWLVGPRKRF